MQGATFQMCTTGLQNENSRRMTKNLENADNIAKLVLSVSTVILFYVGVIADRLPGGC